MVCCDYVHIFAIFSQVQLSLIDRRPLASGLLELCTKHGVSVLAYGVLAGGFLTNHWLGRTHPDHVSVLMSYMATK